MLINKKYNHIFVLIYIPIFLLGFFLLEARTEIHEYLIHSFIDDIIPFNEYFVVFYLAWFPYLLGFVFYFSYQGAKGEIQKREFYHLAALLMIGMSLSLIIYALWPNTLNLRPDSYPEKNIFTYLCQALQTVDTPSNVCPSIHVYISVAVYICIWKCEAFRKKWALKISMLILMILICLSTLFIKQHSVIDLGAALLMNGIIYVFYRKWQQRKNNQ
ncbi:MAG: phosphatase PAP2 family protein [Lachnoclostridium sp.]|jgi:membrane-associated phospholipid phosphatase|nr:phosphatase PAP2 family protein [Lachnoclostridium sp.]